MVKVVLGGKGSGNTKELVSLIRKAVETENGSIVCIEYGTDLRYDVDYRVRLIDSKDSALQEGGYEFLRGFVAGLHGGNYDISQIFIDGLYKVVGSKDMEKAEAFLNWCEVFGAKESVSFTIGIGEDPETASAGIKKYM